MEIIKQELYNECGICCANMLINYYSKNNKNLKNELLSLCNLTKFGLSILEFEVLCNKYKINVDTYQMEWNELINLKTNKPIVLVIDNGGIYHYVIGMVKNKILTIYDPNNLKFKVSSKEQLPNWIGIACLTSCSKIIFPNFKINYSIWKNINFLYTSLFIFLNISWFCLSFITSWIVGKLLNLNPQNIFQNDLWKLGFIYVTITIINSSFIALNKMLKLKIFNKNYKSFCREYFLEINYKNIYFFENFTNQQIIQNFNFGINILNFYCFCWSDIISQFFICISSLIILLLINIQFFIMIFVLIFFNLITFIFLSKNDLKFQNNVINDGVKTERKIFDFLEFKNKNINFKKELKIIDNFLLDLNFINEQKNINNIRKNIWNFIEEIFNNIFNFCLIILLWKNNFSVLSLFFLSFNLFSILNSSLQKIFLTSKEFVQIKPIYKQIQKIFSINNSSLEELGISLDKIISLSFNNHQFNNNLYINCNNLSQHYLVSSLIKKDDLLNKIKINNLNINKYSNKNWKSKIIYIDSSYKLNENEITNIINFLNIQLSDELINDESFKFYLILKSLSNLKDTILIFNNTFKILNKQVIDLIVQEIKEINKNNFLIFNYLPNEIMFLCDNFI